MSCPLLRTLGKWGPNHVLLTLTNSDGGVYDRSKHEDVITQGAIKAFPKNDKRSARADSPPTNLISSWRITEPHQQMKNALQPGSRNMQNLHVNTQLVSSRCTEDIKCIEAKRDLSSCCLPPTTSPQTIDKFPYNRTMVLTTPMA
jgi:hypothetical protein